MRPALPLSLALLGAPAMAQEPLRYMDFAWVRGPGAEGCAPQHAVLRALRARVGYDPSHANPEVTAEVLLSREGAPWRAVIALRDASGRAVVERTLTDEGASCDTLTDAVVESLALALAPALPPPPAPPSPPPPPSAPPPPPRPPEALRVRTSVSAELLLGAMPSPAPGLRWHLEVALPPRGLRVWGAMTITPEQRTPEPEAFWAFGMTRAAIGVAYGSLVFHWLDLSVYGGVSAGLAHGVALRGAPVAPGNYPWVALALGGRAALHVHRRVAFALGAEGHVALARNTFVVEGRASPVFAQPELSLALSAGVELAF